MLKKWDPGSLKNSDISPENATVVKKPNQMCIYMFSYN